MKLNLDGTQWRVRATGGERGGIKSLTLVSSSGRTEKCKWRTSEGVRRGGGHDGGQWYCHAHLVINWKCEDSGRKGKTRSIIGERPHRQNIDTSSWVLWDTWPQPRYTFMEEAERLCWRLSYTNLWSPYQVERMLSLKLISTYSDFHSNCDTDINK